jgi:hypothetical protein
MRFGRLLFGAVLALLLVGVVAGVGWTAYNAGITQGVVESGKLVPPTIDGSPAPTAPFYAPYGFYGPYGFHRPFGFGFGFLGCLVPLFFIFLLFALFRLAFRPRWGRGWGGPWMRGGPGGWDPTKGEIPPAVQEWHRKLHETENQAPTPPA